MICTKTFCTQAFHSEHEVKNYPLKERTQKEMEELHRVQTMRKFEMAACTVSNTGPQARTVCGLDSG